MDYLLAVFRSRSETLSFANLLSSNGAKAGVINTPSQVSREACGVSVKFSSDILAMAQRLVCSRQFQTFSGFYLISFRNGIQIIEKI